MQTLADDNQNGSCFKELEKRVQMSDLKLDKRYCP